VLSGYLIFSDFEFALAEFCHVKGGGGEVLRKEHRKQDKIT